MKSFALPSFWKCYNQLSEHIRRLADKNFVLFSENPHHPSLGFKRKGGVHTAEIGRHYRAIARERNGDVHWFWIGSHEEYNNFQL